MGEVLQDFPSLPRMTAVHATDRERELVVA